LNNKIEYKIPELSKNTQIDSSLDELGELIKTKEAEVDYEELNDKTILREELISNDQEFDLIENEGCKICDAKILYEENKGELQLRQGIWEKFELFVKEQLKSFKMKESSQNAAKIYNTYFREPFNLYAQRNPQKNLKLIEEITPKEFYLHAINCTDNAEFSCMKDVWDIERVCEEIARHEIKYQIREGEFEEVSEEATHVDPEDADANNKNEDVRIKKTKKMRRKLVKRVSIPASKVYADLKQKCIMLRLGIKKHFITKEKKNS